MKLRVAILITVSCVVAGFARAQSPSPSAPSTAAATGVPYTEHFVWEITLVKTKAGLDDDYLRASPKLSKARWTKKRSKA